MRIFTLWLSCDAQMRIAFVSFETVHHRETETNERLQTVLELFRDRGHDVHLFCARWWDGAHSTLEQDDITYHGVADGLETPRAFLSRLPFAIRSVSPDLIHASATPPEQVLASGVGSTLARAPLLVEWYGETDVEKGRITRWATGRPDRIVVPSRLVGTWVQELGANGTRVDVVPNPVDMDLIESIDPGDPFDVVYARRLDSEANLESLLLALAELRRREWSATVIGDGPERSAYEVMARDLRIDHKVTFTGEVSLEERIAHYRGAHVFAQTATRCVFPTELLWALASGCVGIVEYHANSSAHELVEGRVRGFRTTSEEELASAILDASSLERKDYDEEFASFDRESILERYLADYRDLQQKYGVL